MMSAPSYIDRLPDPAVMTPRDWLALGATAQQASDAWVTRQQRLQTPADAAMPASTLAELNRLLGEEQSRLRSLSAFLYARLLNGPGAQASLAQLETRLRAHHAAISQWQDELATLSASAPLVRAELSRWLGILRDLLPQAPADCVSATQARLSGLLKAQTLLDEQLIILARVMESCQTRKTQLQCLFEALPALEESLCASGWFPPATHRAELHAKITEIRNLA